jgi:hypothetical protein
VFSVDPCRGITNGAILEFSQYVELWDIRRTIDEVSAEAEESPLLAAVTRERLVTAD